MSEQRPAWHYTAGIHMRSILDRGFIIPACAGVPEGEIPAVWFSKNQYWEATADKATVDGFGNIKALGMEGTHRQAGGLYRFGFPTANLNGWPRLARVVKMTTKMQLCLESIAIGKGSSPRDWMGTTLSVPVSMCVLQRMNDAFEWVDFDPADFVDPLPPQEEIPDHDQELQDAIRRQVPATEVSFHNGELMLSAAGALALADRVISGAHPGNVEHARMMKSIIETQFPPT